MSSLENAEGFGTTTTITEIGEARQKLL